MKKNNASVILYIEGLKKYFSNNGIVNKAVDDVTFDVHEGEIVGLIGESGSGKTTVGRSLLRLYDDFNGFVTLGGKVISGRHLSFKNKRFLRKNIQMIFQDPHAALDPQKNIYSTLKEPLEVNGITKARVKDIFKDWFEVKENFHYSFDIKTKSLKLDNLNSINDLSKDFFPAWTQKFKEYQYDEELNYEDNFNLFYNYLEEKQNIESQIVNNMYSNTDTLINYYYEKQKEYRERNLVEDEVELVKAREAYEKAKALNKMTQQKYDSLQLIAKYKEELGELKKQNAEAYESNRNTFSNFAIEYKNESKIDRIAKLNSFSLDLYLFNLKKQLINKKVYEVIKKSSRELTHLSYEEVKKFVAELKSYSNDFYVKYFEPVVFDHHIAKKLKEIISTYFVFNTDKYKIANNQNHNDMEDKLSTLTQKISDQKELCKIKGTVGVSDEELAKYKEKYDQAYKTNQRILAEWVEENKKTVKELEDKIAEATSLYKELVANQSYIDGRFKEISKSYFDRLSNDLTKLNKEIKTKVKSKANTKEIEELKKQAVELKKVIGIYKNRIQSQLVTLKSFEIETKYLNKDIDAIRTLLGIKNSKLEKACGKKFANWFEKWIQRPFIKYSIANLLTKTTIYKSLEDVGLLKQFAYRYPHEFSGGQRQRIVIARALITQPKVIVADEPIASLDISIQAQVVNLLKDLCEQKNIGMIFIAHDLSMIEYIADKVEIMHLGKIVESGDTKVVYERPMHPYTINLFKAIPKISNANEKFENISFELNYLEGQKYPNVPELFQVEDQHWLYGTKTQVNEWVQGFNLPNEPVPYFGVEINNNNNINSYSNKAFDGLDVIPEGVEYTLVMDADTPTNEIKITNVDLGPSPFETPKEIEEVEDEDEGNWVLVEPTINEEKAPKKEPKATKKVVTKKVITAKKQTAPKAKSSAKPKQRVVKKVIVTTTTTGGDLESMSDVIDALKKEKAKKSKTTIKTFPKTPKKESSLEAKVQKTKAKSSAKKASKKSTK